ncbi:GNAT family N-acetyltransferase [Liquorilactobacillus satsumensis]|uniref:GNAT family N-acetyltransferase n=1 Tax=Liquorilactobacillus TaxID=2767888 RepID=UPI0021C2FB36|nr:GNAT family N-acetyltransferase [Liquorilactobacillus satsumensis]MCP9313885.1 GNAT family N-acetyltransferase [Liquorilactobacillus satsumensis]MCP9361026.1 GNAT family N-acetyltransferase [Liquorilactobacillus satsumensis]
MKIQTYTDQPEFVAGIVDLVNYCQNIEAHLDIKMVEQSDLFMIKDYYQKKGGQFWLALDNDQVVGTIALLPITADVAVLKKFFTYPQYRGDPHRLGSKLFSQLIEFAQVQAYKKLVLDTPEGEERSHYFYEKKGFHQIAREQLTINYPYPDRNSRIYVKDLA